MKYYLVIVLILNCFLISNCTSQKPLMKKETRQPEKSLDSQLQILTDQIVVSLSQKQKSKIAVIEFSDLQGKVSKFGRYLAEELITRLYLTNKFEVIERQLLNKVLQEHQLNLTGLIDVSSAKELGRILGVDAIASGSVTDLGKNVKVNARLISTETGKIFSVASVMINKDDAVRMLMGESIVTKNIDNPNEVDSDPPLVSHISKIVKQDIYSFELISCKMENKNVTCSLIIKNESEIEKSITALVADSKFFDESGNEYSAGYVKLANSTSRKNQHHINKLIIPGVPTSAQYIFENVSSTATKISLLSISVGAGVGKVKFRNIPLEKNK